MTVLDRGFEELEHTADLCLRVSGHDRIELFENAARGLYFLLDCRAPRDHHPVIRTLELAGYDAETLLVDWLGELLFMNERDAIRLDSFQWQLMQPSALQVVATGSADCPPRRGIKAVTFENLDLTPRADGTFLVTVTFDV